MFPLLRSFKGFPSKNRSAFTLTELIVVITILSILSVIGFVVMSHQSSVARDGKRISDIQTLSQSAKITSAQLRLLPTPIADSIALSVSGTFIGYQGFMSTALVNPLRYGSDKIFDPKDNTPYTYRVNQYYDSAQFMAYLENPRFERSIEIAKNQFLRNEEVGMNGFGGLFDSVVSRAYALDTSDSDLAKRYPYAAGDKLGIFLRKDSNAPIQSGVNGTGSQSISILDNSTLRVLVSEDTYLGSISTGALLSLKDGSFDEKALLAMNSSTSGSGGSGSGGGSGNNSSSGYVLTMGEYIFEGEPLYGYVGPELASIWGSALTTITAGDLTMNTFQGKTIDSLIFAQGQQYIVLENNSGIPNIFVSEGSQSSNCIVAATVGNIQLFACESISVVGPYTPGELRVLGITGDIVTPLAVPSGLNATPGDGEITINWNSVPSVEGTSYKIAWNVDGGNYTEMMGYFLGTSYVHTGLTNGRTYGYKVKAATLSGESEWSSIVYATPGIVTTTCSANPTDESYFTFDSNSGTITGYDEINGPKNIVIPSTIGGQSVLSIGTAAFMSKGLTCVNIPSSVTNIGIYAFLDNQITSVSIPNSVINIGRMAFNINALPDNQAFIYARNMDGSKNMNTLIGYGGARRSNLIIPSNVVNIGEYAFALNQLTSVTIPNSVINIENGGFHSNQLASVIIPNSVVSIGNHVFSLNQLTSVVIGNGITNMGNNLFAYNQLTSVTIPNSVTSIGEDAFYNNQLTSVVIPDSVISIEELAFAQNLLVSVTIPNSVTSIGGYAFGQQINSLGNGTVSGPASGYVKDTYINNSDYQFDKDKLPNYVDQ